jgi:hypothetical protein
MWQLELRNIYLSRDIKSVSELYGQRMYMAWRLITHMHITMILDDLHTGVKGRC